MNYIQELANSLLLLSKCEKMKIDIHFIIPEPLNSFCVEVNQKIHNSNRGFIRMGADSIILPHISIAMGYIDTYQMLDALLIAVDKFAKSQTSFHLNPTTMYFKGISSKSAQYLFLDVLQKEYLLKQKQLLHNQLIDKIIPIGWDMVNEVPHITMGCYKKVTRKMEDILTDYPVIPSCIVSQVGVSVSGNRGVCLGLLKVFQLNTNQ